MNLHWNPQVWLLKVSVKPTQNNSPFSHGGVSTGKIKADPNNSFLISLSSLFPPTFPFLQEMNFFSQYLMGAPLLIFWKRTFYKAWEISFYSQCIWKTGFSCCPEVAKDNCFFSFKRIYFFPIFTMDNGQMELKCF